ncbi:MAG: addiction module toxin, HicA family [Ignavibacteriae bacterium HGW-Ignavibacteriae-3]|nr:MAG: addiction module toxin, HicA family [Ignavibacteriae bacterium HGW-Ignavibacteriae-3]
MAKLPIINYRQLIKKLKKAGFVFERQGRGSHEFWVNYDTKRVVMISKHSTKTIPKGTLNNIIKEAGINIDDFVEL